MKLNLLNFHFSSPSASRVYTIFDCCFSMMLPKIEHPGVGETDQEAEQSVVSPPSSSSLVRGDGERRSVWSSSIVDRVSFLSLLSHVSFSVAV
uniref:Uncharacterized protein n=1 Tax=Aegilops tauschii subsp. strangulata TaxID=200361 RepID=A0A453HCU0_AEGTS